MTKNNMIKHTFSPFRGEVGWGLLILIALILTSCSKERVITSHIEDDAAVLHADSTLRDTVRIDLSRHWSDYDTFQFQDLGSEKYSNGRFHRVGEVLLSIQNGTGDSIVSAYKEVTFYPIIRRDHIDEADQDYIILPHLGYAIREELPVTNGLVGYPRGEVYALNPAYKHFVGIPRRDVVKSAREACKDSQYKDLWRRYAMSYRRGDFLKDGMFTHFPIYYKIVLNCKDSDNKPYQRTITYTEHPLTFNP